MAGLMAPLLTLLATTPLEQQVERWTVRQEARIEGTAVADAHASSGVGDVVIGKDGLLYIGQPAEQTIRVFDGRGRLVRRIGRKGDGQGEFRRLHSIGFVHDTLYATDQAVRRVSMFDAQGTFVRAFELASPLIGDRPPLVYNPTVPTKLLPDGTSLVLPLVPIRWLDEERALLPVFRLKADGRSLDTLVHVEYELPTATISTRRRRFSVPRPFPDAALHELLADGTGVLLINRRHASRPGPATFQVTKIGLNGDTIFHRDFRYDAQPLARPLINEVAAELEAVLAAESEPPRPSEIRAMLARSAEIPRTLPPVTDVASGSDGSIWLKRERTTAPHTEWYVLDRTGNLEAVVELGRNQSVKFASGDLLIATDVDSAGAPVLIWYRVQRGGSR